MTTKIFKTKSIKLAYEVSGPPEGETLFLVHGWPDSPRTWDKVIPSLHAAGYKTIAPYLRGYGKSEFRDPLLRRNPRRTGQPVAFAQDLIELADHLKLARFHFIGHDWGARTGYVMSALFPNRLKSHVALSVPFEPGKAKPPAYPQARAFWYQWLFCTKPGEELFRADPVAYGRAQWDAWSPKGWYSQVEFEEASKSWHGKDFNDVVLHSYRSRWGHASMDPAYAKQQRSVDETETLSTPTLLIHGMDDACELRATTEQAGRYFTGRYTRSLLEGVGHFPQREAAESVSTLLLAHLNSPPQ